MPPIRASVLLSTVLLLAAGCTKGVADPIADPTVLPVGNVRTFPEGSRRAAPAIAGDLLSGGRFDPDLVRGKVVVLNFWGSWCGPCRKEQPWLNRISADTADDGVAFLGVNTRRDQRAAARAYVQEFDVPYPSLYDPRSRVAHSFRLFFMPATIVLDRSGRIAAFVAGGLPDERSLRSVVEREAAA